MCTGTCTNIHYQCMVQAHVHDCTDYIIIFYGLHVLWVNSKVNVPRNEFKSDEDTQPLIIVMLCYNSSCMVDIIDKAETY